MISTAYLGVLGYALGAGVATFFAPCAYPLLPGYVGYYVRSTDGDNPPMRGALVRAIAAATGSVIIFVALTALIYAFGRVAVAHLEILDPVVGAALVVLGVAALLDRVPTPHYPLPGRRRSVMGFFVFGAAYAVAAAGCVLPVIGAVVLQALQFPPLPAAIVVVAYAAGICALMLGVTLLTALGVSVRSRVPAGWAKYATPTAGVVMVVAGIWQLYRSIVVFHALPAL